MAKQGFFFKTPGEYERAGNTYIPLTFDTLIDTIKNKRASDCEQVFLKLKYMRELEGVDALERKIHFLLKDSAKIYMYGELLFQKAEFGKDSTPLGELVCLKRLREMGKDDDAIIRIAKYLRKKKFLKTEDQSINLNSKLTPIDIDTIYTFKMKHIISKTQKFYDNFPKQKILHEIDISIDTVVAIFEGA